MPVTLMGYDTDSTHHGGENAGQDDSAEGAEQAILNGKDHQEEHTGNGDQRA